MRPDHLPWQGFYDEPPPSRRSSFALKAIAPVLLRVGYRVWLRFLAGSTVSASQTCQQAVGYPNIAPTQ